MNYYDKILIFNCNEKVVIILSLRELVVDNYLCYVLNYI